MAGHNRARPVSRGVNSCATVLCVFMFCIEILQNSVGRYGAYCAQHAVTLKCKQASESPGLGWFMKATGSQLEFHPTFAGLALVS